VPKNGVNNTAVSSISLEELFHLPLSVEAFQQFQDLSTALQTLHLSQDNDVWSYRWGSTHFSSKQVYKHLVGHSQTHSSFRWLWTSCCQNKRKIFFWLIKALFEFFSFWNLVFHFSGEHVPAARLFVCFA